MPNRRYLLDKPSLKIHRDDHGVPHVEAESEADLYWGLGYCHACDRGLQMLLMRILGNGRGSELLDASEEMLAIDTFFRRMNWYGGMDLELAKLTPEAREFTASYCQGVNAYFSTRIPWELKLLGYRAEAWQASDVVLLSRMIGYLTLAQSQAEIERLFLEMVQAGVAREKLDELFPDILEGLDENLLKQVKLVERVVPPAVKWNAMMPRFMASNNWVISGKRTASGQAMLANDPHLETNRLPNVWYEIVLTCKSRYTMGATMPGLPAVLLGRNPDLAWGATYTFMDAVDSWIEHCKEGKYRRGEEEWHAFRQRREIIKRKGMAAIEIDFYENEHGVLEGDPLVEGYYLATRWAPAHCGVVSINQAFNMWHAATVEEGMSYLGQLETAWNWVLADRRGNMGYQMSGLMPKRRPGISGFVPLPGWQKENDWQGFVDHKDLPRCLNPAEEFLVTANNDLNAWGIAKPINNSMGSYRAERIAQLLSARSDFTLEGMYEIQFDVYSLQAERLMSVLRPLLPDTPQGKILRDWDLFYQPESQGAFLFEQVYHALLQKVFGENGMGREVTGFLARETGTFVDFFNNFDRVLLAENSVWFNGENRNELYRQVASAALNVTPQTWGESQKLTMTHLLLGNRLPKAAGFDRGPLTIRGGRATPHQGQIYRSGGRTTSFIPSFRMVTDLAHDELHTNLAGGPSDRRFSKWYCSDLKNWLKGSYKKLAP